MLRFPLLPVLPVVSALTLACASPGGVTARSFSAAPLRAAPGTTRSVMVGGDQLARGGSLLDALERAIPDLRVADGPGGCPLLRLHAAVGAVPGTGSPSIFVQDAPVYDPCVLRDLSASSVERVEVYRNGFAAPARYQAGPEGLILVFLDLRPQRR